jgi:hypothetical protein
MDDGYLFIRQRGLSLFLFLCVWFILTTSSSLLSRNIKIKERLSLKFHIGVKLDLSHYGKNMGQGCSRNFAEKDTLA